jgi:hypothetical protein
LSQDPVIDEDPQAKKKEGGKEEGAGSTKSANKQVRIGQREGRIFISGFPRHTHHNLWYY